MHFNAIYFVLNHLKMKATHHNFKW